MSPRPWQHWLDRLYDLRRDKRGDHEKVDAKTQAQMDEIATVGKKRRTRAT